MSSGQITLLDLPSQEPCRTWSLNPWKSRLLLNYKGLDYKTEWVEYPDVKPRISPHLPPNEVGTPYTIPTVILPDGTWVMDSRKIVEAIEKRYPEPSVHLDSPYQARIEKLIPEVMKPLFPAIIARIPKTILREASVDYWYKTRAERFGLPCEENEQKNGGEKAYNGAEPSMKQVTDMLNENPEGPFFMGKTVCYADFVWVGTLIFLERANKELYNEMLKRSGDASVHIKLLEACSAWTKRDGHYSASL